MKFLRRVSKEQLSTPRGADGAAFPRRALKDVESKLHPILFRKWSARKERNERGGGERGASERSTWMD